MRAAELGIALSIPTTDCVRYDAVFDDGTRMYRVQIKYCDRAGGVGDGAVRIELTSWQRSGKLSSSGYTADEIDALLLYVPKIDKVLWFGPEVFAGRPQFSIRFQSSKNGQMKGCLFADDYIW
jgi:PD-(D/E)XK endonuclease